MKKVLIVLGGLVGFLVLAAVLVPLFVDVDKYRPTIEAKANEQLNGKIELGKLHLSLWGTVKVAVDGMKLIDGQGTSVVDVRDASFNLPLLSLLTGRPELRLVLDNPAIKVIKQRDGKLNVMNLMKPSANAPQPTQPQTAPAKGTAKGPTEVPAIVMNARLTFLINHAKLAYRDQLTGDTYNVNDLNVKLHDVSPSSDMPFEVVANLDVVAQQKMKISGPIVVNGDVKAKSSGGEFHGADAKAALKLDGLTISYPGVFSKAKGVPLNAEMAVTVGKNDFNIPTMRFRLDEVTIDGQASGKTENNMTSIDFMAHSNRIDIAKLSNLSPLIKEYNLNGLIELSAMAHGPVEKLGYGANLKFTKITLNHETLKQPLELNGVAVVATNELKQLTAKLTAKDFDLSLDGAMQDFAKPRFKFTVASQNLDLDQLLKSSAKAAEARKEQAKAEVQGKASPSAQPVVDYNAMFKPLRENPVAASASGTVDFNLKRMKSTGVVIHDLKGQLALNNLVAVLKNLSLNIFDGSIKGEMSFDAKPVKPQVATNVVVTGLRTEKMVESQVPFARNTIKGVIGVNLNIGGFGLNRNDVISGWKGGGGFDLRNALVSTLDIGREIKDGVIARLPDFVKSKVHVPDAVLNKKGEYELISAKFALASGALNITDITGKAKPNEGFDFKGQGSVRLSDYGLNLHVTFIDTYNLFGSEAQSYLKDANSGKTELPTTVGNTLFAPRFDWTSTVGKLAQNAARNKGMEELKKAAPPAVKGLIDKIPGGNPLKGLFGN